MRFCLFTAGVVYRFHLAQFISGNACWEKRLAHLLLNGDRDAAKLFANDPFPGSIRQGLTLERLCGMLIVWLSNAWLLLGQARFVWFVQS